MDAPVPVVVLATADFDAAVWTNKQHLTVRLAESRPVVYLESFGLRRPTFSRSDLRRILRRLRPGSRRTAPTTTRADRPPVIAPLVVPLHGSRAVRALNRRLIDARVLPRLPEEYVLWTFSPLTYGLEERAVATVYHSVDLIHRQPHMPAATILSAERRAIRRADAVVASSRGVRDHLHELGAAEVLLWENVADTDLFSAPPPRRRPRAVFAGHLTPTKIDIGLLQAVVDRGVDLVLCGPLPTDGTQLPPEVSTLLAHPRCDYRGNRTPAELADLFAECEVGLIPYLANDYTAGVFPMKVYEYLAAGLAVVSTELPSLAGLDPALVARGPRDGFADAVAAAVDTFDERAAHARRDAARPHSWTARGRDAADLADALAHRRLAPERAELERVG